MSIEHRFYRREFLNQPGHHTTGHILAYIEKTEPTKHWSGSIEFTLADCSRQISLSFDIDDEADRANSLHKLDLLIDSLQQFKKAFEEECAVQQEREKRQEALDKPTDEPG